MHRSRIGIVLIDHPADRYEASLAFWAHAAGRQPVSEEGAPYHSLGPLGPVNLEVQRTGVGTPQRIHLDIETDDVPAEVARLRGLGARPVDERSGYTIMADPGGLVFCVVPVQTGDAFREHARLWD
jgi:hypothetical protein